ncbi:hypothetical protein [Vagococcus fluvialis]|uniref:Uncharacterized protein n=1 Tax=Vagococcus fluvialis TaxID=2738 RepID=A0A7X6I2T4_9ENTE|nr:hypothetical protein [Vagococcus fluvialis]NKC67179.1 hypothetical protein [Vagococcus fluvialis]
MEALVIDVKRTGFPIKIGRNEFFFDSSIEGISKYQKNYMKALEEVNKLEIEDETNEEEVLKQRVEVFRKAFDIILGNESFDKIYEEINDIIALERVFYKVVDGIEMHVKLVVDEYSKQTDDILSEYQNKFK